MNSTDFVYIQVYKGALKAGASERASLDAAIGCLDKFKRGKFKNAGDLIVEGIKSAKRATGRRAGGGNA